MPYIVGLTGGFGSGKSTVSSLFAQRGAIVIDADAIVHEEQRPGTEVFDKIVETFGKDVLNADGSLDRPKLGSIVFNDAEQRDKLTAIVWPAVGKRVADRLEELRDTDVIVLLDVPLMAEATDGSRRFAEAIIVVDASKDAQLEHLEAKGVGREDAEARIAAQASREERLKLADHVIDNNGSLEDLQMQVDAVWAKLTAAARSK